jgi:cytochrome c oxidase subunit 2
VSRFLPPPASAHAADIDLVLTLVHVLMGGLFVGWTIYFVWVLIRFRAGRQPHADHAGARGRTVLVTEVGVVIAEVVLLIGFALPIWFSQTDAQPGSSAEPITSVRVVAEQFAWNVHYPGPDGEYGTTSTRLISASNPIGLDRTSNHAADDVVVVNQLHVPVARPVVMQLSSKDVVHSFGVPAMRVKQDAIPGRSRPCGSRRSLPASTRSPVHNSAGSHTSACAASSRWNRSRRSTLFSNANVRGRSPFPQFARQRGQSCPASSGPVAPGSVEKGSVP